MSQEPTDLARRAAHWAMKLTRQPSVNGTADEMTFGPWLAQALRASPTFGPGAEIWTIPVAVADGRECVALLLRGQGRKTVLLAGHFDTVSIDDYADLRGVATDPDRLLIALRARLAAKSETPSERRAKADFDSGDYLPGRGLLDMKSGLAAGLAVMEQFSRALNPAGNLLFIAVPDEENASAGARQAAPALAQIAKERGLDLVAAINLDATADDGNGDAGRTIALGTVGKLLPTVFVAGVATHGGFPLNGINAAALLSAIALEVEWAPELTDDTAAQPGTPPSLLSLRDGKAAYDVTTPATAFATWNVLIHRRSPMQVLDIFDMLCLRAASSFLTLLADRANQSKGKKAAPNGGPTIQLYRFEQLRDLALRDNPSAAKRLKKLGSELATSRLSLPEQCSKMTEHLWQESGLGGPAIVTGFGSIPYLPTQLSMSSNARRLDAVVRAVSTKSTDRYGVHIACTDYFAGISDMSFFGEADEALLDIVGRNTPVWKQSIRWPIEGALAKIPTVNVGPWGRDYHTPLERLNIGYAFDVLPSILEDLVQGVLV